MIRVYTTSNLQAFSALPSAAHVPELHLEIVKRIRQLLYNSWCYYKRMKQLYANKI